MSREEFKRLCELVPLVRTARDVASVSAGGIGIVRYEDVPEAFLEARHYDMAREWLGIEP